MAESSPVPIWPADEVVRRKLADLKPYEKNARKHPPWQVEQIANSMREWGWTIPILLDENDGVIAGHGRIEAAQKLGWLEVPCMTARGWSDAQKRAYVLADNKLALNAEWDLQMLDAELKALDPSSFALMGFNDADLASLAAMTTNLALTDAHVEWQRGGMPGFDQPDIRPFRSLLVHFRNAEDVAEFARIMGQALTEKTKWVWFPERERNVLEDKRYVGGAQ